MIVRMWRGRASAANPEGYADYFRKTLLPELKTIEGFVGASLLRRAAGDAIELTVLTRWQSLEAIRAFAGTELEKAVVEPEAVAALVDYDRRVTHFEVVEDA